MRVLRGDSGGRIVGEKLVGMMSLDPLWAVVCLRRIYIEIARVCDAEPRLLMPYAMLLGYVRIGWRCNE